MGFIFSPSKPSMPEAPKPVTPEDPAVIAQQEQAADIERQRKKRGMASTILTESSSGSAKSTLLGN